MNSKVLNHITQKNFIYAFMLSLTASVSGIIYCIMYGQRLASAHLTPVAPAFYQGIFSIAVTIIFLLVKPIRAKPKWFVIPVMLFATCFLYEYIVGFYPCCVGG